MDNSFNAIPSLMEDFARIDQEKKAKRAELRRKNAVNKANGIFVKCGAKPLPKEERLKFLNNTFVLPKLPLDERGKMFLPKPRVFKGRLIKFMSLSQAKRMCKGRVLGLMHHLHQYMTASLNHLSYNVMTPEQKEFFRVFPFATKEAYSHPNKNTMVLSFLTITNTQYLSSFQDTQRMLQAYAQFFPGASESPSDYHDYPIYPDIDGRPDSNTPFLARIKRDLEAIPKWLTVAKPQYSKRIKKNIASSKLDTIYSRHGYDPDIVMTHQSYVSMLDDIINLSSVKIES